MTQSTHVDLKIDELDRIGIEDVMHVLGFNHRESVFRWLKSHPDFPPAKRFGHRLSWARGAVLQWVRAQPDRTVGDPDIAERLVKARKGPRRYYPRKNAKAPQLTA